jgi:hypothetical protein
VGEGFTSISILRQRRLNQRHHWSNWSVLGNKVEKTALTTREFVSLEKSLLPELPGFAIKGPLMFIPPAERLLRGISFEGSSFDKTSF